MLKDSSKLRLDGTPLGRYPFSGLSSGTSDLRPADAVKTTDGLWRRIRGSWEGRRCRDAEGSLVDFGHLPGALLGLRVRPVLLAAVCGVLLPRLLCQSALEATRLVSITAQLDGIKAQSNNHDLPLRGSTSLRAWSIASFWWCCCSNKPALLVFGVPAKPMEVGHTGHHRRSYS